MGTSSAESRSADRGYGRDDRGYGRDERSYGRSSDRSSDRSSGRNASSGRSADRGSGRDAERSYDRASSRQRSSERRSSEYSDTRSGTRSSSRSGTRADSRSSSRSGSSRGSGTGARTTIRSTRTTAPRDAERHRLSRDSSPSIWDLESTKSGGLTGVLHHPLFFPACLAVVAIVLLIIIGMNVSRCAAGNTEVEQVQQAEEVQADQQVQQENTVNGDIAEDLRWRDEDFAVDPTRTDWTTKDNGRKVVYITLDDGPSSLTQQFLDLFDQMNVKATFFVTGQDPDYYYLIHEAYKRGHTIGLHSYSHDYASIYKSEDSFYSDLAELGKVVEAQIGYVPCFFRFPGGSSNTISADSSSGIMTKLTKSLVEKGYQYWDWNLDTGDGAAYATMQMLAEVLPEGTYDDNGNFIESSVSGAGDQAAETPTEPGAGEFENPGDVANNENAESTESSESSDEVNLDDLDDLDDSLDEEVEELDDEGTDTYEYPENIVLLCHDAGDKEDTLKALPAIIKYFQSQGYSFEALDRNSMVCHHEVNN